MRGCPCTNLLSSKGADIPGTASGKRGGTIDLLGGFTGGIGDRGASCCFNGKMAGDGGDGIATVSKVGEAAGAAGDMDFVGASALPYLSTRALVTCSTTTISR